MKDPLENCVLKILQAGKNIHDVQLAVNAFIASGAYSIRMEDSTNAKLRTVKAVRTKPIPGEIAVLAGQALHNLRSSLDVLVCSLATDNGASSLNDVSLPFRKSKTEFEGNDAQKHLNKLSAKGRQFIDDLEPYRGGNELLCDLHDGNVGDKHRNLSSLKTMAGGSIKIEAVSSARPSKTIGIPWLAFDNETILSQQPLDTDLSYNIDVRFDVGFAELKSVACEPIATALQRFWI